MNSYCTLKVSMKFVYIFTSLVFLSFQIEFRTMCLLSDDQPFVLNISRTHHCGTKRHGTNLTHLTNFQPMLLLSSRQSQYNFEVIRILLIMILRAFSSSKSALYKDGLFFFVYCADDITPEVRSRASLII